MKFAKVMKYWQQKPTLMEALIQKHYLLERGFVEVGISSTRQTAPDFNKELMKKLQGAEEVAKIPFFNAGLSRYLGGQETIVEGKYQFFAIFPEEEEEKIPDTLPGGFRAGAQQYELFENPASPFRTIKRKLPSGLLSELDNNIILYENVEKFYFEPHQKKGEKIKFKHNLTIDDIILLSKMEIGNTLDTVRLRSRHSSSEDRKAGKHLDDHLSKSQLVEQVGRTSYTLSSDALEGMYAAVVHKKYLPDGFRN